MRRMWRQAFPKLLAGGGRGQQLAADAMQELAAEGEFLFTEGLARKPK